MSKTPILIVSGYTKEVAESGEIARVNHQAYASRHGYSSVPFTESGVKPPVWIEQPRYLVEQSTLWHLLHLRNQVHRIQLVSYFGLGGYLAKFDQGSYTPRDQAIATAN
jgi:hypothetical protein